MMERKNAIVITLASFRWTRIMRMALNTLKI